MPTMTHRELITAVNELTDVYDAFQAAKSEQDPDRFNSLQQDCDDKFKKVIKGGARFAFFAPYNSGHDFLVWNASALFISGVVVRALACVVGVIVAHPIKTLVTDPKKLPESFVVSGQLLLPGLALSLLASLLVLAAALSLITRSIATLVLPKEFDKDQSHTEIPAVAI